MPTALYKVFTYFIINYSWIHKSCNNVIQNTSVLFHV